MLRLSAFAVSIQLEATKNRGESELMEEIRIEIQRRASIRGVAAGICLEACDSPSPLNRRSEVFDRGE